MTHPTPTASLNKFKLAKFTLAALKLGTAALPAVTAATLLQTAHAHEGDGGNVTYATDHAPIGVMADHRHKKGEWMVSYRYMHMAMDGNRDGTDRLSPEEIATTAPNPFFGAPMQPPTLRVVPTDMSMGMHMAGLMYGLSDRVTLMAMGTFVTKEMDHITFQGPMGADRLGTFTTRTTGVGDTTLGAIIGLDNGRKDHRQINLGVAFSLPTGSITETDQILTPMGTTPSPRLPYPMQLGSGSFDVKPSATARTRLGKISVGAQASAVIRLNQNDESYAFGDGYEATAWLAVEPQPWISVSGRLRGATVAPIKGQDPLIIAPVQTADPLNQGGDTIEALGGINLAGSRGWLKGHRLAIEVGLPLYRNLNGPQLETDLTLTVGWQKAF
ncbi:MAG: transporter [Pseudomonadota bacterium]